MKKGKYQLKREQYLRKKEQILSVAETVAKTSPTGKKDMGAVIIKAGKIIATGCNGTPEPIKRKYYNQRVLQEEEQEYLTEEYNLQDSSLFVIHAEQNAILTTVRKGINLKGSELYVTLPPCTDCAKDIAISGIKKVHFSKKYKGDPRETYLKSLGVIVEYIEEVKP